MDCKILESGLEGSLIIFILTLSFKIYKMNYNSLLACDLMSGTGFLGLMYIAFFKKSRSYNRGDY